MLAKLWKFTVIGDRPETLACEDGNGTRDLLKIGIMVKKVWLGVV